MGRWSTRLAPSFIRFVGIMDGQCVLDVGCGTGSLTRALLRSVKPLRIVGVDPVESYVSFAQQAVSDSRVEFQSGAAEALAFPNETFDAALSLLVHQDIADPRRAVREMARVTRRGGPVVACQWDFKDGLPMLSLFWQTAEAVAPKAVARHRAGNSLPKYSGLTELVELWTSSGISEVRTASLELSMEFTSFDDFWLPFLGGATPTSTFAVAVDRETGGALARMLRDKIDVQSNGSFVLPARAWAVAGIAAH